jgi:PRTRC genetic system ThiF family protein
MDDRFSAITPFLPRRSPLINIALVGCGGTGSWLVEHLAGMAYDIRRFDMRVNLMLIDGDRVEEANIGRQNFQPRDIGHPKSAILAQRYSAAYGIAIGHVSRMATGRLLASIGTRLHRDAHNIVIGCVDRASGRRAINTAFIGSRTHRHWHVFIDSGNDHSGGSVRFGTTALLNELRGSFRKSGICAHVPIPTLAYPNLLSTTEGEAVENCANAMLAGAQSLTINRAQALHVFQFVYDLIYRQELRYWQTTLDYTGERHVATNTMLTAINVVSVLWEDNIQLSLEPDAVKTYARRLLQSPPRAPRRRARHGGSA